MITQRRASQIMIEKNPSRPEAEGIIARMTPAEEDFVTTLWLYLKKREKKSSWLDAFYLIREGRVVVDLAGNIEEIKTDELHNDGFKHVNLHTKLRNNDRHSSSGSIRGLLRADSIVRTKGFSAIR